MEAVGARLGRSSTRYGGPATVFTGPVRKWKKKWVPLSNPNPNPNNKNNNSSNQGSNSNGNNNNDSSHLLVYKWTPLSRDSSASSGEQTPRKKLRYVPVAVVEDQKQEEDAADDDDDEKMQADDADEKPTADVDEVKQEEEEEEKASEKDGAPAGEVSGASLDLNLGIKARDGDRGSEAAVEDEGSEQAES